MIAHQDVGMARFDVNIIQDYFIKTPPEKPKQRPYAQQDKKHGNRFRFDDHDNILVSEVTKSFLIIS